MNNSSIVKMITDEYIGNYMENGKKINYTDLCAENGLVTVLYDDLPYTEMQGYPVASDYVDDEGRAYSMDEYDALPKAKQAKCKLRFYYLPCVHEMYVGTTGSGKTTGCIEPQLRAVSSQCNKPCLFVTDPKGELAAHNIRHLRENGYQTYVVNFKDPMCSDKWNPLLELYDLKMEIRDLAKQTKTRRSPVRKGLRLMGAKQEFGDWYLEFDGRAFPTQEKADAYLRFAADYKEAKLDSLVSQLACTLIRVQSNNDKSWEYGAQNLLKGLLMCMLEDAVSPASGFTRDMMTFMTLQQYYITLKTPILDGSTTLMKHSLTRNKSQKAIATMATALNNAGNTMRSYCGVFDGAIKDWFQGHIFSLTNTSTIDLGNAKDKPFAIFLVTRDYEKSDFLIAGIFVDWIYRRMLEAAETKKTDRALHFLLDEFGNIPPIADIENKIATARSRNIWFHLVLQSYRQLEVSYTPEVAQVIKDNCAQIFLGSSNMKSKQEFCESCGKHSVPTLEAQISPNVYSVCELPLIPVSSLNNLRPGDIYVLRERLPVILSQYIRSYRCAQEGSFSHYYDEDGFEAYTPITCESFRADRYLYDRLRAVWDSYYGDNDDDFDPFWD